MSQKTWTIRELLAITADFLQRKEIDSPRLSAEILLAHQLNIPRIKLYLDLDKPLNKKEVSGYRSLIKRRLNREPLQYITGVQEFWSLDFMVGPGVMVPRPETELLVELVISLCRDEKYPETQCNRILDLCTGSGVLCISLSREFKNAAFWAGDISAEAIDLARSNARKHGVEDRIEFRRGDLFEPFKKDKRTFDIIVTNPPYIASEDFSALQPEIRDYEPMVALDGREEGMFFIEKIIAEGNNFLNQGGWVLLEMDPDQTERAARLIDENPGYDVVRRIRDYSHHYRVVMARKKGGIS
ncbi:MAG: peptide chain release factor N(5)-glutamine methyltransferase [Pseudomonadota bacterium]